MNLTERVDLRKIHYLKSWKFSDFKSNVQSKSKSDKDLRVLYDRMLHYCDEMIKGKGEFKRTYHHTLVTPLEAGGRLFCGGSIQGFPKAIRGFLFGETTTDIDFANMHPKICLWICQKNNIKCAELLYYCENRKECLNRFPDPDVAKNAYLCACNDDKLCRKLDKYPKEITKYFKEFDKEMKQIQKKIIALPQYKSCVNCVPSTRQYNFNGSAINRIFCYEENRIIQIILDVLATKEIELSSLMFDGCMPYGDYYENQDLLKELEDSINKDNFSSYKLTYKGHCKDIVVPIDFVCPTEKEAKMKGLIICEDELAAGDYIYSKIHKRFAYCGVVLWFRGDDYVWGNNLKFIEGFVNHFVINSGILRLDSKGEPVGFVQNYKTANNVRKIVIDKIMVKKQDDNWLKNKQSTSLGKILFSNGFYNFKTSYFLSLENLDDDTYFFEKIDYNWSEVSETDIEDIRQRFFTDPLGKDVGNYFALNIARGLAGDAMKRFIFCIGGGNTGKSILTQAIQHSCGGYFGTFNAGNLAYKDNNDEAQALRWLMLLTSKRIIVSNEIKTTHKLDSNAIKKMSSGGRDLIVARGHGGNETEFPFSALAIVNANDACDITPKDDALGNRLKSFTYNRPYVTEVVHSDFELLADPNVDWEINTSNFKLKFINLLMSEYKNFLEMEDIEPPEIAIWNEKWFKVSKDATIADFLEYYEITGNSDDFIPSKEIQSWIDDNKLKISITKLAGEFNKYCAINKLETKTGCRKKYGSRTVCGWTGIRWIPEHEPPF